MQRAIRSLHRVRRASPEETQQRWMSNHPARACWRPCMALIEDGPFFWGADWVCSLPLIVLNVAAHVSALSLIGMHVNRLGENAARRRGSRYVLTVRLSFITLLVILLHGAEAAVWAVIYVMLGAVSG